MLTLQQEIINLIKLNNMFFEVTGRMFSGYEKLLDKIKELEDEKFRKKTRAKD